MAIGESMSHPEALAEVERLEAEIERLEALVRDAYNEGFSQGMREVQTSCGGLTFVDSKTRAILARKEG